MRQPRLTSRHSARASAPPGQVIPQGSPPPGGGAPVRKRRNAHAEDDLQRDVCAFLDLAVKRPARYFAAANGGKRDAREAARMKAMGVKAGVSDLHFIWAFGSHGQFPAYAAIELKVGKNAETDEQARFGKDIVECGHTYQVCRSLDEVVETLKRWGFPLGAEVLPSGATFRKVPR